MSAERRERLHELLADRAFAPLSAVEAEELTLLLGELPDVDADAFDRVAAELSMLAPIEDGPVPAGLRGRLESDADAFFALPAPREEEAPLATVIRPSRFQRQLPWGVAIAAAAALAAVLAAPPPPAPTPEAPPSVASLRDTLLVERADVVRAAWSPVNDATGEDASGDIVWSDGAQQGFMRFDGLAVNDPTVEQYQLWIFDRTRSDAQPVDGGVFDVAAEGEVIVPIDAKLPVGEAWQFAVTVERPGGVVVSDRSRIALLAAR